MEFQYDADLRMNSGKMLADILCKFIRDNSHYFRDEVLKKTFELESLLQRLDKKSIEDIHDENYFKT